MKRLIPSQIKEESTIVKGLTAKDLFILAVGISLIALTLASSLPSVAKLVISIILFAVFLISVITFDMVKGYKLLKYAFLYIFRQKKIKNINLEETFELKFGDTIKSITGYTAVVELHGIDFGIFEERTQDDYINAFCEAIKETKNGKLIKLEKPMNLSKFIDYNDRLEGEYFERQGEFEDITAMDVRCEYLSNQTKNLERVHYFDRVNVESYYFAVCEGSEEGALLTAGNIAALASRIGLQPKVLKGRELKLFTKLFFTTNDTTEFNEEDEKQGTDEDVLKFDVLREKVNKVVIDGVEMRTLCLGKYPYFVGNAWAHDIFSIPDTKVVFNFTLYTGKAVNKVISRSMSELRSRLNDQKLREDERLAFEMNYNSLENLLEELNYSSENLYFTEFYLMYPAYKHREILKIIRGKGIRVNDLVFTQYDGWLSMLPFLSMPIKDNRERFSPIQSSTIAGAFPFVAKQLMDNEGAFLGYSTRYPAFFNQFVISETRVNHNMVILGKSGGGKSFFMKKMVARAAAEGKRIFILDPDNEYDHVCSKFRGNWIDVGGETSGRINPLQVFPSLREGSSVGDVSSHRLFLDQFFRTVCADMSEEVILFLNKAIADLYAGMNITDESDLSALQSADFPTFDTFKELLEKKCSDTKRYDAGEIAAYKKVLLYVEQFATGGLYSRMWNGITTLEIKNDFNVLNFQSLFANNNRIVANGQMLLLMRFLNREVIKNRELNKYSEVRKYVTIIIDEAHRFINPQFPVALDFMSTMGKQIRKYSGALTVATQNIDDFIGVSEEMKAQASAVINACQYSMIFGLFADDVNKVKELYANYNGGLTQGEIDLVTRARRGEALFIIDINTRLPMKIEIFDGELEYMEPGAKTESEEAEDVPENDEAPATNEEPTPTAETTEGE